MPGKLHPGGQGGKPVGLATRARSQRINPQGGIVSAQGHSDPRASLDPTRGHCPVIPIAAPRSGNTRSPKLTGSAGARGKQGDRHTRSGRVSGRGLPGLAGPSQRAHRGVLRATKPIPVDGRRKLGRSPRVPEPVNPPLPEVAPAAGRDIAIGPRADPQLSGDEVGLTRHLGGPNLGHPGTAFAVKIRGRKVRVGQVGPELRDIVGGGIKDLRVSTHGNEAARPQITVPDGPSTPSTRVLPTRREGTHRVGTQGRARGDPVPSELRRGGRGGGDITNESSTVENPAQSPCEGAPLGGAAGPPRTGPPPAVCASSTRTSALRNRTPLRPRIPPLHLLDRRTCSGRRGKTPPGAPGTAPTGGASARPVEATIIRSRRIATPHPVDPPAPEPKSSSTPVGRAPWRIGPEESSPPQSPHSPSSSLVACSPNVTALGPPSYIQLIPMIESRSIRRRSSRRRSSGKSG